MLKDIEKSQGNDPNNALSLVPSVPSVPTSRDKKDKKDTGQEVISLLGQGIREKIIGFLYYNPEKSYQQISEKLGFEIDSVKKAIRREDNLFTESKREGMVKFFKLSDDGEKLIEDALKKQREIQKAKEEAERRILEESTKKQNLETELKNILNQLKPTKEGNTLYFNFRDISQINYKIADLILDFPEYVFGILNNISEYNYRIINLPDSTKRTIQNLRSNDLDKLITLESRVVSISPVRPLITNIKFECPSCGTIISVLQNEKKLREPSRCSCGRRGGFKIINKELKDYSKIILEDLKELSDNPQTQRAFAFVSDDLVHETNIKKLFQGNEIKCYGILKEINTGQTTLDWIFEIYHAELLNDDSEDYNEIEEKQFRELSDKINKNGMREISESFAPDVYGYEQEKNALILQSVQRQNDISLKGTKRNKSHILFIGDPALTKSILSDFSLKITPKSRKATGGGSSAVGLTATIIQDKESLGGYRLEYGSLILARELLFIDELNNLSDEDKPKLQDGMSECSITINKATIHNTLPVTCGIVATANPIHGHFKENVNETEQFNIPSPILNRFDLTFKFVDRFDEEKDKKVSQNMLNRRRNKVKGKSSKEFLKKFLSYIRNQPEPEFSDPVIDLITEVYVSIRKLKRYQNITDLSINARFQETLERLCIASAKLRLSPEVEKIDLERVLDICNKSHYQTPRLNELNLKLIKTQEVSK